MLLRPSKHLTPAAQLLAAHPAEDGQLRIMKDSVCSLVTLDFSDQTDPAPQIPVISFATVCRSMQHIAGPQIIHILDNWCCAGLGFEGRSAVLHPAWP